MNYFYRAVWLDLIYPVGSKQDLQINDAYPDKVFMILYGLYEDSAVNIELGAQL